MSWDGLEQLLLIDTVWDLGPKDFLFVTSLLASSDLAWSLCDLDIFKRCTEEIYEVPIIDLPLYIGWKRTTLRFSELLKKA